MKLITDLHNITREVEVAKKKPDGASDELLAEQSRLRKETEAFLEEREGLPLTGKGEIGINTPMHRLCGNMS